jgi:hypothetical protein
VTGRIPGRQAEPDQPDFAETKSALKWIASPGLRENSAVFVLYRTLQAAAFVLRISAD